MRMDKSASLRLLLLPPESNFNRTGAENPRLTESTGASVTPVSTNSCTDSRSSITVSVVILVSLGVFVFGAEGAEEEDEG